MSVLATEYPGPMVTLRDARRTADGRARVAGPRGPQGPRTARPAALRLTGRGRAVVVALAVVGGAFVTLASQQAVAGQGGGAVPVDTRTVVAGETLWDIAGEYASPGQDIRVVVEALLDLNGLQVSDLRAGQELLVPAQ